MDSFVLLRCRNAELETELRLVKEQLAQAHSAANYLATTFSKQQSARQDDATAQIQQRLDCAQAEDAHLRTALHLGNGGFGLCRNVNSGHHVHSYEASVPFSQLQDTQPTPPSTHEEGDLLSFDDGDSSAQTGTWSSPFPEVLASHKAPSSSSGHWMDSPPPIVATIRHSQDPATHGGRAASVDFGASNVVYKQQSIVTPPNQSALPEVQESEQLHAIENSDGTRSFIMMTPPSPSFQTQSTDSPSYEKESATLPTPREAPANSRWMVPNHMYRNLLGVACFAEDWDDEKWEEWAAQRKIHSAEQWRKYYAEEIRPQYLRVQAKRAAALGGAVLMENDGQAEEQREGGDCAQAEENDGTIEVDKEGTGVKNASAEANDESAAVEDDATEADGESLDSQEENAELEEKLDGSGMEGAVIDTTELVADDPKALVKVDESEPAGKGGKRATESGIRAVNAMTAVEDLEREQGLAESLCAPKHTLTPAQLQVPHETNTSDTEPDAATLPTVEEYLHHASSAHGMASDVKKSDDQHQDQPPTLNGSAESSQMTAGIRGENYAMRPQNAGKYGSSGRGFVRSPPSCSQLPPPPRLGRAIAGAHPTLSHDIKSLVFSQTEPMDIRTVLISNIPPNITLSEVLHKVRGGKIVSAILVPTAGMNTNPPIEMNAAMVTFLYNRDAQQYVDFCNGKTCIFFWSEEWDAPFKASVSFISTPSRPVHSSLFNPDISRTVYLADNGSWHAENVAAKITRWSRWEDGWYRAAGPPMRSERDEDGILRFEFAAMADAENAKLALEYMKREFGGMSKGFLPDPCARPVEGLKEVAEASRPEVKTAMIDDDDDGDADSSLAQCFPSTVGERSTFNYSHESVENEETYDNLHATSPSRESAYIHKPLVARNIGYTSEDVELARALMNSYQNIRAKPSQRPAHPRRMRYGDGEGEGRGGLSHEVLLEDEAMDAEG